jgi:hypothetical protein
MVFKTASKYLWIICFIVLLVPIDKLFSQVNQTRNAIYIEGFGPGLFYSINYERYLSETFTTRIGFSSWTNSGVSFTGIPLMVNYLYGSGNSKLELGIGMEYLKLNDKNKNDFLGVPILGSHVLGISSVGYRYQPSDGGMHFRFTLYPMLILDKVGLTIGISIGVCF